MRRDRLAWLFMVLLTVIAEAAFSRPAFGGSPVCRLIPSHPCQGDVVRLEVASPEPLAWVEAAVFGETIPLVSSSDGHRWWGWFGVDLERKPGSYVLVLRSSRGTRSLNLPVRRKVYGVRRLRIRERPLDARTLARIRREREKLDALWKGVTAGPLWKRPFLRPVPGRITGSFGVATFINGQRRSPHSGVDFHAEKNENVRCSNDGVVAWVADLFFSGTSVFVDHGAGLYTMYFHLARCLVRQGDRVHRGEVIGKAGSTGRSTGPHLHWGARLKGARINPLELLDGERMRPPEGRP